MNRRRDLVKRAGVGPSEIEGWGLIARERITAGEVVDESPALITQRVPADCSSHAWVLYDGRRAFPCGDGVFVNHSIEPNALVYPDFRRRLMRIEAIRDIRKGEEITVDYGCGDRFERASA